MDIQKYTHQTYRVSVLLAIVMSAMAVTLVSLLGRGTLNLRGALTLDEPTEVTVIASVEPKVTDATIEKVDFLRREYRENAEKPSYSYYVKTSDGKSYFVRLTFSEETKTWSVTDFEALH